MEQVCAEIMHYSELPWLVGCVQGVCLATGRKGTHKNIRSLNALKGLSSQTGTCGIIAGESRHKSD